jgi:peptidoglycan/LPS O-acetylase OafA/YrhL
MNNTITQKRKVNKMNVKPKFLNVMKQRIITLMMMLALVIVTGSAFAQSKTSPSIGVPYTYNLTGVVVTAAGTATVTYINGGSNATLPSPFAVTSGTTSYSFNVTYNAGATAGTL